MSQQSETNTPHASAAEAAPVNAQPAASTDQHQQRDARRWWIKLIVQPALVLVCAALAIAGLGLAQRVGWISAGGTGGSPAGSATAAVIDYICPMMCTPPQHEPGRCPVCAMELVPATAGNKSSDDRSVHIDPVARRVANIHTVAVRSMQQTRTKKVVGKLTWDEGTLRTISAWVPGRIDKLYADYTGVVVRKGDHLALVYSPELYSGQVELLLAKKAAEQSRSTSRNRVLLSDNNLYESARERLIELGMTEDQIAQVERDGQASSRLHLCAPSSGTVIEKLATDGDYVREGQAIYRLADLSTVWLMLELFPEDAAAIRYGQKVRAQVQSLPGRVFDGRVAFINPHVDESTRTVGVRVVIPNPDGVLRIGDFATATIEIPVASGGVAAATVFDPDLADKWISPRHPHIVSSAPGPCPLCGIDLVPAADFGFANTPPPGDEVLIVPRSAVLMAGDHSVIYVETEPGRFELRRVRLGPTIGRDIVILDGVRENELVATSGNFLIDSQMQLAGNPSLIDPTRIEPGLNNSPPPEVMAALSQMPAADRELAEQQRVCPVTEYALGSMGVPPVVEVNGQPVYICCEGCRERLLQDPDQYIARLASLRNGKTGPATDAEPDVPSMGDMQLVPSPGPVPPPGEMQLVVPAPDVPLPANAGVSRGGSK